MLIFMMKAAEVTSVSGQEFVLCTTEQLLKSFAAHLFWNTEFSSGDMHMPYFGYVDTVMADMVLMRSSAQHLLVFEIYCGVKIPSIY